MSTKNTRLATNVDTKQMEEMRAQVVEQELSARSWKAYYEKMYYSLEAEKIEPEYVEYKKRMEIKLAEQKKQFEDFMKTMQENQANLNGDNPLGTLKVDSPEAKDETPVIQMQ